MGAVASGGAEGGGKIADWWSGTGKPAVQSAGRGLSTAYGAIASGQVGNGLNQFSAGLGGVSQGLGSVSTAGANLVNTAQVARAQVANALKSGRGEPMTADDRHSLEFAIGKLQGMLDAEGVDGGCECRGGFFGGAMEAEPSEGLASYAESASARMKESVVSGIGAALKDAGMAIDTSSPERIVASIAAAVPDPRGKPLFSADREKQAKACKILASVLNAQFTPGATRGSEKFVDDSGPPEEVCRQVGEWVHAFTLGVNTEFLAVHASVRNAMEQVQVLLKLLEVARKRVESGVKAREDPALDQETGPAFELLTKSEAEMKRLMAVLSNILHVNLGEAEDALKFARDDEGTGSRAIRALIKRAGVAGTPAFAKGLGAAVAGLGGAADVAHRVHLALKAVGISVGEFLGNRSFTELKREVHRRQEAGELPVAGTTVPPSKGDPAALVVKALDLIEKSLGDFRMGDSAPEYAAALRADAPGPREVWAGALGGAAGGADPALADQLYGLREPKPYESRDKREKLEKQLLVRDFAKRMADRSAAVVTAVQALAPKLGAEVPLSDRTEALAEAVRRLPMSTATGTRMELALLGFGLDAAARMQKDAYLAALRAVSGACADLVESAAGGRAFGELKTAVDELVRTLDFFADTVAKKYGAAEAAPAAGAGKPAVAGGADEELDLAKALPPISRAGLSLPEAVHKFQYAYYTARVKENLSRSSAELESYGKQYEDLLGRAVASKLQELDAEEATQSGWLAKLGTAAGTNGVTSDAARFTAGISDIPDRIFTKAHCENITKRIKIEFAAKRKFYKALQAMDLYMKAFTAGLAKDPAAVRDAVNILDETQTIAKWFSEMTGEHIWKAFEALPGDDNAPATRLATFDLVAPATGHLFDRTEPLAVAATRQLGCPLMGVHITADDAARVSAQKAAKHASDAVDAFQGLKNLVNTFARVGSSFGGKDLKSLVFMSPAQIYAALTEFLKVSAMSTNLPEALVGLEPTGVTAASPLGGVLGAVPAPAGGDLPSGAIEGPDGRQMFAPVAGAVPPGALHFGMVADDNGATYAGLGGRFTTEDKYFVMIVKSMAAKVLTTLGVYDMFIREHPHYELTPARMIMGGGDDSTPEVFEGAAELYCRLPRLAEFYSAVLKWGSGADGVALPGGAKSESKIALVPDLEGVFSGLIRQVFRRATTVSSGGDYSDSELYAMVREINRIFEHFQKAHPENTAREVFAAFVLEVNRRYGVVKKEENARYWKLVRDERMMSLTSPDEAETDYAILPGEEDLEATRAAPSDRYFAASAAGSGTSAAQSIKLDDDHVALIKDFRAKLDTAFSSVGGGTSASYGLLVKQAAAEMRRLRTPEERFAVAARLIQSTSIAGVDSTKAMMFHETVMMGLNALSVSQLMLSSLQDRLAGMDPVEVETAIRVAAVTHMYNAAGASRAFPVINAELQAAAAAIPNWDKYARYVHDLEAPPGAGGPFAEMLAQRSGAPVSELNYNSLAALVAVAMPANVGGGGPPTVGSYAALAAAGVLSAAGPATLADVVKFVSKPLRDVRADYAGNATALAFGEHLHLAARLLTNYEQIMVDYLEHVFAVLGPLVEARFSPEGGVRLNFSKLRGEIEKIMATVRQYYEQFRPYLDAAVVKRFEDSAIPGSLAWVSRTLFDGFLLGDDSTRDGVDSTGLERLARQVQVIFANLVRDTGISLEGVTAAACDTRSPPFNAVQEASTREWFGNAFSRIVHYDATMRNFKAGVPGFAAAQRIASHEYIAQAAAAPPTSSENALRGLIGISSSREGAVDPLQIGAPAADACWHTGLYLTNSADGPSGHRSLMFSFNQLVARYLATFIDAAGGKKIYLNLINAFANGAVGMSVQNPTGSAHPDLAAATTVWGARGDPKPTAVLFQSLALVLQRIVKDVGRSGPNFNEPSLTEIPIYMKESMRANLPGFIKLFETLLQKCDFIKRLFQQTSVDVRRPSQLAMFQTAAGGGPAGYNGEVWAAEANMRIVRSDAAVRAANTGNSVGDSDPYHAPGSLAAIQPFSPLLSSDAMKARLAAIIDAVAGGCATLATAATECLKELGDAPLFFQTGDGSIEQYRARNEGALPLMPLSLAFLMLRQPQLSPLLANARWQGVPASSLSADTDLWPRHIAGTAEFKMAYGVRQLLARGSSVDFEQLPGVKAMLDAYNGVTARREQIEEASYLKFVQSVTTALRQAVDTRRYRAALASVEIAPAVVDPLGMGTAVTLRSAAVGATAVFALDTDAAPNTQAVVTFVESTDQEGNRKKIADQVGGAVGASGNSGRTAELYANLIDLNIMPINLHALMRGVPLANLYNYAYTYDQYIASMYGKQASVLDAAPGDTTTMFLKLLSDPFLPVTWEHYGSDTHSMGSGGFVHRMFRGDNGLGMGRPKFLSDQLANKALYISIYQDAADLDEGGPAVGIGRARGVETGPALARIWAELNGGVRARMTDVSSAASVLAAGGLVGPAGRAGQNFANTNVITPEYKAWCQKLHKIFLDVASLAEQGARLAARYFGSTFDALAGNAAVLGAVQAIVGAVPVANPAGGAWGDGANPMTQGIGAAMALATTYGVGAAGFAEHRDYPLSREWFEQLRALALAQATSVQPHIARSIPHDGPSSTALNLALANIDGRTVTGLPAAAAAGAGTDLYSVGTLDGNLRVYFEALGWRALAGTAYAGISNAVLIAAAADATPTAHTGTAAARQVGPRATKISYLKANETGTPGGRFSTSSEIVEVPVPFDVKMKLESIGKLRFDTRFVRKLMFITNVNRLLRLKLQRELLEERRAVVGSIRTLAPGVTEYGQDPFGANDVYESRTYAGESRFPSTRAPGF